MSNFNWKKSIEDSIKDGLIITATTTEIFFALKAANVKHQRHLWMLWISSKLPVEYVEGYYWWKIMQSTKNGPASDTTKISWPLRVIELHNAKCRSVLFCRSLGSDQPGVVRRPGTSSCLVSISHFSKPFYDVRISPIPQNFPASFHFDWPEFFYFSMVKIPLGWVTAKWATASSRLNT